MCAWGCSGDGSGRTGEIRDLSTWAGRVWKKWGSGRRHETANKEMLGVSTTQREGPLSCGVLPTLESSSDYKSADPGVSSVTSCV